VSDLVTGEAVVLELRLAKFASRALSVAVDIAVQVGLLIGGLLVIGGVGSQVDEALAAALALVTVVLVLVGYPVAFETLTRGRTLGKLLLGLRVVRDDGGPIRFRHALVRALLAVVEIYLTVGAVALLVSLASPRGKRLGDFLAGTVVVRERLPVRSAPLAAMPPPLAAWASTLDLSRVPDDLALAARQLLARAPELVADVREAMARRMADDLARVTAPAPPPGTPALAFLAAVVAERRNRETARLGPPGGYAGYPGPYAGQPGAYAGQPGAYAGQPLPEPSGAPPPAYRGPPQAEPPVDPPVEPPPAPPAAAPAPPAEASGGPDQSEPPPNPFAPPG
jgi:uncharacterized RDD family membrane protein YckC